MGKKNYQPQLVQDFVHQQYLKNSTLHSLQTNRAVPKKNGGIQESSGSAAKPIPRNTAQSSRPQTIPWWESNHLRCGGKRGGGWIHAYSPGVFFSNEVKDFMGFGKKCYLGLVDLCMNMYACSTYIYTLGAGGSPGTPAPRGFIHMKLGWGGVGWGW